MLVLAFLVRAALDRGRKQAFGVGFVVCGLGYALTAHLFDDFGPPTWRVNKQTIVSDFPPTQLWLNLCPAIASRQWIDANTGGPLSLDPTRPLEEPRGQAGPHYIKGAGILLLHGHPEGQPVMSSDQLVEDELFSREQVFNAIFRADQRMTRYAYVPLPWPSDLVLLGHCYAVVAFGYLGGRLAQHFSGRKRTESPPV